MLRFGILSSAKIGVEHVVPALHQAVRAQPAAIASREQSRADELATQLDIPRAHGSYEAMLEDPDIDAVYIGLPNHLHQEWTIRFAEAGKHVLCEKPLGLDEGEVRNMVDRCNAAGVVMMEAFMYRTHPAWIRAVELVRSGRLGELRGVQSWFSFYNDDPNNIRNQVDTGGGALYDIGCYGVDSACLLMDADPDHVAGAMTIDAATGVDIVTMGLLAFGHRLAGFTCSTRAEPDQRVHVAGSDARLSFEIPFNAPADRDLRLFVAQGGNPPADPAIEEIVIPAANQYATQADAFAATVLDDAPLPVPHHASIRTAQVMDRLRSDSVKRTTP